MSYALLKFLKVNRFSDRVVDKIRNTPFSHFWDIPLCKVVNSDIDTIVSNYVGDHYFLLGSVRYKFSVDDVVDILEIPKGVKELVEVRNYKPTSQLEKIFKGKTRVKKWDVEKELQVVINKENFEDDDIVAKLGICLIFSTFLIPDSSCTFPSWLLQYIDDLQGLLTCNWALYTPEVILDSLEHLKSYCLGSTWALLVRSLIILSCFKILQQS